MQRKGRRGWRQKLWGAIPERASPNRTSPQPCLWFHAVSVGEVNLLAPLLDEIRRLRPELQVAISTSTETGFDLANAKHPEHLVFFCPFDVTWAIKSVLKRLRPAALVLVELELWPNLIRTVASANIPVVVVNGRLSESSFNGYRKLSWLLRPVFERLSLVGAQTDAYADRFRELGVAAPQVITTGNVKFDGVQTNRSNERTLALCRELGWVPAVLAAERSDETANHRSHGERIFLAGSTQLEEDLMAARVYQRLMQASGAQEANGAFRDLRLVLVPRHPQRCDELAQRLREMGLAVVRRSELAAAQTKQEPAQESPQDQRAITASTGNNSIAPVLIVDVIGELGAWWGAAEVAFVGGSMGSRGGQNMLEPAAFGMPISFGPNTVNFREIVSQLLAAKAAVVVRDEDSLLAFVRQSLTDRKWSSEIGTAAQAVVRRHRGAAQRTGAALLALLDDSRRQR